MEEEMRKIEKEFAFQEKWIKIFKRGKFFFQNIPEHLILKIITKLEAKDFLKILMTGKWMLLLCEENRGQLLIRLSNNYFYNRASISQKEKEAQIIKNVNKLLNSKYYFYFKDWINFDKRKGEENINFKETFINQLRKYSRKLVEKRYWRTAIVSCPLDTTSVDFLQPVCFHIGNQTKSIPKALSLVSKNVKRLRIFFNTKSHSNFGGMKSGCFGPLPLRIEFSNYGVVSLLAEITKERHSNKEVEYLTFLSDWEPKIINSWPNFSSSSWGSGMGYLRDVNFTFYWIIVSKSEVGVVAIFISWEKCGQQSDYSNSLEWITSLAEWEQFGRGMKFPSKGMKNQLYMEFKDQVANKFFENGRVIYPEPAPEFVEFLKKFEDFDIEPEKLAPHKPKWKKTEKLPDLPQKLPEIHSNNWLIEAKEIIKLRKFWMDFLQKGKFIMEKIPLKNVLDIAKKIEPKHFPLLFSSTKWVNELIQNSASNFRIHGGSSRFLKYKIYRDSSVFKEALKALKFYYLNDIRFFYFNADDNELEEVLEWVRERKIFVKQISLDDNCPLIQKLFESFARGPESLVVDQDVCLPAPVKFSPQLKEIVVDVKSLVRDRIKKLTEELTGIEQAIIWLCDDNENTNKIITHQLETLKSKKCRSNILIRSRNARHSCIVNYDPQFNLSQISETVFIFRSMARGRGGVWNYFIRLEKAGSGAVGIALFADSLHVIEGSEKNQLNQFDIRCEYFPTIESFLDYFEREVGSKRGARDWMQLREKDETIEPREEDFNDYKIRKPYIHFNEQKEADDFKEVRRRFFS